MSSRPILHVAVPVPLRRTYDYLPPESTDADSIRPGMRVVVQFGAQKQVGVIIAIDSHTDIEPAKLRPALTLPDEEPTLPADILALVRWAAGYYHAPIGEALNTAIPVALRSTRTARAKPERGWELHADAAGLGDNALKRAPAQAAVLELIRTSGLLRDSERIHQGIRLGLLKALEKRGLIVECSVETGSQQTAGPASATAESPLKLNSEQQSALTTMTASIGEFACFLLEGVTGSGKTEVYLQLIQSVLELGRQALVLVPEIGLTPQTERRFQARFGDVISVLHSGLGDAERLLRWQAAADGSARVVIGTRSAVFTPIPDLGIIIIDEEHDASFKQHEGFRYSARDVAIYRASNAGIPIVLGSATPSIESLSNAQLGRYHLLQLQQRAGDASPPTIELLDIRGLELDGGASQPLLHDIRATLQRGEQALVFINRRGWAPVLCCPDCGWIADCQHCDARMTLHRGERRLWCHHCDTRMPIPTECPSCRSARLSALGAGTERCEHVLQRHFPGIPIRRIDRGSMQGRDAMEALIDEVNGGEPCILVGTQMLAKGHHFANVTLVAILDMDAGLFSADFRAPERTAQLLVQVAGRAGRAQRPGRVLIQTMHPTHPWLRHLVDGGYRAFIDPLMTERRERAMPPFCHVAIIRCESPDASECLGLLDQLKATLQQFSTTTDVVGPVPATMQRRGGRHRFQLLLRSNQRAALHNALRAACYRIEGSKISRHARWHVDVDPQSDY